MLILPGEMIAPQQRCLPGREAAWDRRKAFSPAETRFGTCRRRGIQYTSPARAERRRWALLAHRLADLSGGGDRIVDVPRERLRLLGGLGEVTQHRGNSGRAQPEQVEAHVLHCQ